MTARSAALALALASGLAHAGPSIEGEGRISVLAGYRWAPNWYFNERAAANGTPVVKDPQGGPGLDVAFAYGATESIEAAVDLVGSWYPFELAGYQPFNSVTYGALAGVEVHRLGVLFEHLGVHLGVQAGPTFSIVSSPSAPNPEKLQMSLNALAGFTWRLNERWGVTFDVRYMYARAWVADIAAMNTGGVWFSVGVTSWFPAEPKVGFNPTGM